MLTGSHQGLHKGPHCSTGSSTPSAKPALHLDRYSPHLIVNREQQSEACYHKYMPFILLHGGRFKSIQCS